MSTIHSEIGIGGSKRIERQRGGELAPKVAPRRLGLWAPKLANQRRFSRSCTTKTLPTRKNCTRIIFEITVTRFELFRINFGKLPDTYCVHVS